MSEIFVKVGKVPGATTEVVLNQALPLLMHYPLQALR